jgi:hypothetical protein
MINDPRMGTLVVASAGADAQAQQVISQRDRTDKGVVFLWTRSRDAKAGLAQLKGGRRPRRVARDIALHVAESDRRGPPPNSAKPSRASSRTAYQMYQAPCGSLHRPASPTLC